MKVAAKVMVKARRYRKIAETEMKALPEKMETGMTAEMAAAAGTEMGTEMETAAATGTEMEMEMEIMAVHHRVKGGIITGMTMIKNQ